MCGDAGEMSCKNIEKKRVEIIAIAIATLGGGL